MPRFETPLVVAMIAGGRVRLTAPLVYVGIDGVVVTVPAGFESDLASVPQLAQALIGKVDDHAAAAVLHDWLYATAIEPRAEADAVFLDAMQACAVPAWKRRLMWAAVRLGGGRHFPSRAYTPPVETEPPRRSAMHLPLVIRDNRLYVGATPAAFVTSPNVGGRMEPTAIVLHDTAGRDAASSIAWLTDVKAKASAHFVIGRDGRVTQLVETDRVAWHCGKSSWRGRGNVNGWSIGIELDNPGRLVGDCNKAAAWFGGTYSNAHGLVAARSEACGAGTWLPYTEEQLTSLEALIAALVAAQPAIVEVIGHHDIAPGRKVDPTPLMDWSRMRACLGARAPHEPEAVIEVQEALAALGYWPGTCDGHVGPRTRSALRDFQEQHGLPTTGRADEATTALLFSDRAKPAPTGGREDLTAADLRRSGSVQAVMSAGVKRAAEVLMVGTTTGAVVMSGDAPTPAVRLPDAASTADVITRASEVVAKAEAAKGLASRAYALGDVAVSKAGSIGGLIGSPIGLLVGGVLVVVAVIWAAAHLQERARVRAARRGQHVGL